MSDPDLVVWLNACYDRAERVAKAAQPQEWYRIGRDVSLRLGPDDDDEDWVFSTATRGDAEYIASIDPAWRLADIGRKRKVPAEHAETSHRDCRPCGHREGDYPCPTVRLLAEEFDHEPGYDERWRT